MRLTRTLTDMEDCVVSRKSVGYMVDDDVSPGRAEKWQLTTVDGKVLSRPPTLSTAILTDMPDNCV